ncbi:glycoside hydrolase family 3 C-terminal domain-containing protein [Lentzea sp. JNUCC 0626]|uniref:glycoside hydrolase family 3 C-terminal domain-containing protein n=1 Tax=Lentzea sp. JNUCC 0626 TaxID=3367513 RepID=UPI00374880B5
MHDDHELVRLVGKLDLRAKVRLLAGGSVWRTCAEPSIGLRALTFSDGPAGVRGPGWDERRTSLAVPSPTALGATWDEDLVHRLGALLAAESRRKGVDVLLAPVLNLHRTPYGGRHFECFAEDPLLTARLGVAYVQGVQSGGVAAAPKHFVANETETDRLTHDVRVSERTLRELYLAPFEAVVEAGAWAVMSAYNGVNGHPMSENPLLTGVLKEEWGFDGVVVSDWGAVRTTVESASSGQDLSMPGPWGPWGDLLVAAVEAGEVAESAIDDKVLRLLRLAARVGALESGAEREEFAPAVNDAALLREAVSASTVLLRNNGILPLHPGRTIALIGPGAAAPRVQGGGSSGLYPSAENSLLDALTSRAEVVHAPGVRINDEPTPVRAPVQVRVLGQNDEVLFEERRLTGRILETEEVPGARVLEISTTLHVTETGPWRLAVAGYGRLTLDVDGTRVLDVVQPVDTDDPAVKHLRPPHHEVEVHLEKTQVELVARRELGEDSGMASLLAADPPTPNADQEFGAAIEAASRSDVAIVVVSTTDAIEGEGRDRTTLSLPGEQDALVTAVCLANPNTVVVVNSGGPVLLPWRDDTAAVLLTWFPGQEGGHGLADVLFGEREPGGRLPTTWPVRESDVPVANFLPDNQKLEYDEGLDIGYRAWAAHDVEPAYWFGHGLGYTTWDYLGARAERGAVRVRLRNTGRRRGREVVQVYLSREDSTTPRPRRWLGGFASVVADAGETVEVLVEIPPQATRHWENGWVTESGGFTVHIGPNAGATRIRLAARHVLRPR